MLKLFVHKQEHVLPFYTNIKLMINIQIRRSEYNKRSGHFNHSLTRRGSHNNITLCCVRSDQLTVFRRKFAYEDVAFCSPATTVVDGFVIFRGNTTLLFHISYAYIIV